MRQIHFFEDAIGKMAERDDRCTAKKSAKSFFFVSSLLINLPKGKMRNNIRSCPRCRNEQETNMRQTKAGIEYFNHMSMRLLLCMLLLIFGSVASATAAVSASLDVSTEPSSVFEATLNASNVIKLRTTLSGGVGPYELTYKNGDTTIKTENLVAGATQSETHTFNLDEIGGTDNKTAFRVLVQDQSDMSTDEDEGDNNFFFDFTAPVLTATITDADTTYFATESVNLKVVYDEAISQPKVVTNGKGAFFESHSAAEKAYYFRIDLTEASFPNGNYTINITASDTTSPASGANKAETSLQFTVEGNTTAPIISPTLTGPIAAVTDIDGEVALSASWGGGTAPFEVILKDKNNVIVASQTVEASPANFTQPANSLGSDGTSGSAKYSVEIIPSGSTTGATAEYTVNYNFVSDSFTVTLTATPATTADTPVNDSNTQVTLTANWSGGTAPYAVQFFKGSEEITGEGSVTTTSTSTAFLASELGVGSGQANFTVRVTSSGDTTPATANATVYYNLAIFPPPSPAPDVTAVSNATLGVTGEDRINGGGTVAMDAQWEGDGAPFVATYKKNGSDFRSFAGIPANTHNVTFTGLDIGDSGGSPIAFSVQITNSVGSFTAASGDKSIIVDTTAPILTAQLLNGPVFSNTQTVRIQITSNENVAAPTVTANGVNATQEGTAVPSGMSFIYALPLSASFSNGSHVVSIQAKDVSKPETSANTGNTTVSFTVGTTSSGNTAITGSTPASPTKADTITLAGSCPEGAASIELQDNGTAASTISVSGSNWTIGLSPAPGTHSYVAISKDSNGTEISRSAAFSVIIDREAPAKPTVNASGVPGNTNQSSVSISVEVAGLDTEVAKPVQIQAYVNGSPKGSPQAVNTSPVNMTVALDPGANRITFRLTDAAGNTSEVSDAVNVTYDNSSSSTDTIVTFSAPFTMPIPVTQSYQMGAGTYSLQMIFGKAMDSATNPVINITTAGGVKITSSAGNWIASNTFVGEFSIPTNGGSSYDGAATLSITGAKDTFGNTLEPISVPSGGGQAFFIDSTPATASFNETTSIYVSSSTPNISLSGQVSDNSSGVGYIDLVWQPFSGGAVASQSVPIMAASPSPWNYSWNASSLSGGQYKLWVVAADQAKPSPNIENYLNKAYRIVVVDRDVPTVSRVSLGNMATDINMMPQPVVIASAVTRLTAVVNDTGDSGIAFNDPGFVFTLVHDGSAASILGNKSNNGVDTIYFDFPELTLSGTYTVTVTPMDAGGNVGVTATRSFSLEKDAPDAVTFLPPDQRVANYSHAALSQSQVWAIINHARPDYTNSTISVRYNGAIAGSQQANASTSALVWQLHSGALATDQSHDGRYDMTVVPKTTLGNTGAAVNGFFTFDSKPPVVTSSVPSIALSSADSKPWFGLGQTELSVTVSDAPRDIVTYGPKMPADSGLANVQVPGDPNWYNSAGSGVDYTNSSFTWSIGASTSGNHNVVGNKLVLGIPPVPDDTAVGVTDVVMSVKLLDRANAGENVPNMLAASYTLRFDYLAPEITSVTLPNGGKYRGSVVKFEGLVQDKGTSEDVKVSSVEWAEGSNAWTAVPANGLPAKSASVSANLNIGDKADGTYTVKLRAIDLANNVSAEKTATFVVDRTPPAAPVMVLPLPDQITNKRSQSFKWGATTDADRYLLQVADDPSFNNILNNQAGTDYPTLLGQVLVMTEGAFTMPKDGTYYWRVAAIETCVDGYNISNFSVTRRFTVDTVKPLVVEVQPAPSSANKISTGMVTFTIRFSELVDPTMNPTVKLTTNGGQLMVIEKTSYKEDTWTGTTVIPKNSSALYDGVAIISIEGATDLAGNIMAADSTNNVVINTGPSFTTRIFSNPANEYEIMIVTKASEALQSAPSASVQQSSARTPVIMNFLKERFYAGSYKIDINSPGKAYIDVSGSDLHGMVGNDSFQFTVADLNASRRLDITSASGLANLRGAEGSTFSPTAIYMLDREHLESPFAAANFRASALPGAKASLAAPAGLTGVMPLEEIGPASLKLKKRLLYTANVSGEKLALPAEKIHIYRQDKDGNWIFQGGSLKDGKISAELTGLGRIALMADLTEPAVLDLSPASLERLETPMPEIKGQLVDNGSGIRKDSLRLFINDLEIPGVTIDTAGNFNYKLRKALPRGRHEIRLEVADQAGNVLRKSFQVEAPAPFALDEFMPYPNPVTGNSMYFNYNFNQNADLVKLKVYDTAGHRVADFDTFDFASTNSGRIRWDLRNRKGKIVANGVYFYQLEVTRGGQTLKKRGKFAVMR